MHWFLCLEIIPVSCLFLIFWNQFGGKKVQIGHKILRINRFKAKKILGQLDSLLCLASLEGYKMESGENTYSTDSWGTVYFKFYKEDKQLFNGYHYITFYYNWKNVYCIVAQFNYLGDGGRSIEARRFRLSEKPIVKLSEFLN